MAAPPGVTRAGSVGGHRAPRAGPRRLRFALVVAAVAVLAHPAVAQTGAVPERGGTASQDAEPAPLPSPTSLERVRRGLSLERAELPGAARLDFLDDVPLVDQRPVAELLSGLAFIGGVDPLGSAGRANGPLPFGPPTHRDMLNHAMPREMTEAVNSDALGIATSSAFVAVPYLIKTLMQRLGSDDGDDRPDRPILTAGEETLALDGARADGQVLEADIRQRGRTVALSLVVPADTPPDTARALGERFVLLVKTFASAEPDPDDDIGTGDFDYIVRVTSPVDTEIALGAKTTSESRLNW